MFLSLDFLLQYKMEHVTIRLSYIIFILASDIIQGEFQALQLIVLGVFGAMDQPLSPVLVPVLENSWSITVNVFSLFLLPAYILIYCNIQITYALYALFSRLK